jgi:hypothetical protein
MGSGKDAGHEGKWVRSCSKNVARTGRRKEHGGEQPECTGEVHEERTVEWHPKIHRAPARSKGLSQLDSLLAQIIINRLQIRCGEISLYRCKLSCQLRFMLGPQQTYR